MTAESMSAFDHELEVLRKRIEELRSAASQDPTSDTLLLELESAHEELRVADEEVRAQQKELEALLESQRTERWMHERLIAVLPAAVLLTDGRGVIRMGNAAAAALLRLRVDHLLGKPLFAFVDSADRSDLRRLLATSASVMTDFRSSVVVHPRKAESVSVEVAATLRRDVESGDVEVTWVLLTSEVPETESGGPHRNGTLARALVELTRLPLSSSETGEILARVAEICQRAFTPAVGASISLGEPDTESLVTTGSKFAESTDRAQAASGEGPRRTAWESCVSVHSRDLRDDHRWPRLRELLRDSAVRSAVAVPIVVGDHLAGTLNLYSDDDTLAGDEARDDAELLGTAVAAVLYEVDVKSELATTADQLKTALESRATIDQAKGIVMAIHGCGPERAFQILANVSSSSNVKLRDLAARMVEKASQGIENLPDQR